MPMDVASEGRSREERVPDFLRLEVVVGPIHPSECTDGVLARPFDDENGDLVLDQLYGCGRVKFRVFLPVIGGRCWVRLHVELVVIESHRRNHVRSHNKAVLEEVDEGSKYCFPSITSYTVNPAGLSS